MTTFVYESLLDTIIANQRKAIIYRLIFASLIIIIGLVGILVGFLWTGEETPESFKTIIRVGGGFVSSLSSFQFKEIIQRREKIGILKTLSIFYANFKKDEGTSSDPEVNRLKEIFWKVIEKDALG